jgi:diguanylate cyclase (GGDEF)-like protein
MEPGPEAAQRAAWLRRVPPPSSVALAAVATGAGLLITAYLLGRRGGSVAAAEALVAVLAVGAALLSPVRLGSPLALALLSVFAVLEVSDGQLSDGLNGTELLLAFSLAGALLAASYVRLGIRRRDAELELAADAIAELTRRDRITQNLSGGRDLTWLQTELQRAQRHHHQLALVLVRPDAFDELAELGGSVGVEVLEACAEVIGHELRATDYALRQHASTFALILPQTATEGARVAGERIRLFLPLRTGGVNGRLLTVSIGVATFPDDATTNEELVRLAERALERAEERGGNRTVCASADALPPGWTLTGASS